MTQYSHNTHTIQQHTTLTKFHKAHDEIHLEQYLEVGKHPSYFSVLFLFYSIHNFVYQIQQIFVSYLFYQVVQENESEEKVQLEQKCAYGFDFLKRYVKIQLGRQNKLVEILKIEENNRNLVNQAGKGNLIRDKMQLFSRAPSF